MAEVNSFELYVRREAEERRLAARAVDPAIAKIHQQLASEYADKISLMLPSSQRIDL